MRTRLVFAALAAVGASLLVASAGAGGSKAEAGGTLRYNHTLSDYEYIDPQKCYDTLCGELLWPTQYNLMQYPEKNGAEGKRLYPEAATALPVVSKDGKTYTFTVRGGVKASNGKTVTPQWFVRAFERVLSPKMGDAASARSGAEHIIGPVVVGAEDFYQGKAGRISGLQVKGDKLAIQLTKPFPSLLSVLAMVWFTATDPATPYSEQDPTRIVGVGPYFVSSREAGRSVVLDRNPNYKGSRPANVDRIVVTVGGDQAQSMLQVKAGQADVDPVVPAASAAELGEEFGVNKGRFFVKPTAATTYWAMTTLPGLPFADVKLRQAVNWAIDRPQQVRIAGKYAGRRTSQILPPPMPGFIRADNLYAYKGANPERARQVAGDTAKVPEIRILHSTSASTINRGQVMRYNLEQIGLKAKTEPVPSAQVLSRAGSRTGNYDMIYAGWQADYPDPSNFINVLLDGRAIPPSGSSNNHALFSSPKFTKLMDEANALSGDPRFLAYGKLDIQMMKEAAPLAPVLNPNNRIFVSARVSNVVYNEASTFLALNAMKLK